MASITHVRRSRSKTKSTSRNGTLPKYVAMLWDAFKKEDGAFRVDLAEMVANGVRRVAACPPMYEGDPATWPLAGMKWRSEKMGLLSMSLRPDDCETLIHIVSEMLEGKRLNLSRLFFKMAKLPDSCAAAWLNAFEKRENAAAGKLAEDEDDLADWWKHGEGQESR